MERRYHQRLPNGHNLGSHLCFIFISPGLLDSEKGWRCTTDSVQIVTWEVPGQPGGFGIFQSPRQRRHARKRFPTGSRYALRWLEGGSESGCHRLILKVMKMKARTWCPDRLIHK